MATQTTCDLRGRRIELFFEGFVVVVVVAAVAVCDAVTVAVCVADCVSSVEVTDDVFDNEADGEEFCCDSGTRETSFPSERERTLGRFLGRIKDLEDAVAVAVAAVDPVPICNRRSSEVRNREVLGLTDSSESSSN